MKKKFNYLNGLLILIMIFLSTTAQGKYKKKFFDFTVNSIDGDKIELSMYKGKTVLLINTASNCGFTKQYSDMESLWRQYKNKGLIVLAVPSNSFKQEKNNNDAVKKFCEINFNTTFPMTSIYDVKGDNAHSIYKWAEDNYGAKAIPKWNFHKILINNKGTIEDTYGSFTKPNSKKIIKKIESILN